MADAYLDYVAAIDGDPRDRFLEVLENHVLMYFSGYGPEINRRILNDAGFDIVADEIVSMREPAGEASFQWILAAKRGARKIDHKTAGCLG